MRGLDKGYVRACEDIQLIIQSDIRKLVPSDKIIEGLRVYLNNVIKLVNL